MMTISLMGAYGRAYINKAKALNDWQNGKDFKVVDGAYCSIRDMDYLMRFNNKIQILLNDGETIVLHDTIVTYSLLDEIL